MTISFGSHQLFLERNQILGPQWAFFVVVLMVHRSNVLLIHFVAPWISCLVTGMVYTTGKC